MLKNTFLESKLWISTSCCLMSITNNFIIIIILADYMDTYYRLLRAEVYSRIQKGIRDLKSNKVFI
jgi:hypothetical protein